MIGDSFQMLATLPSESVQCCVTSPPYWGLRDYGVAGQMGSESTPEEFVNNLRLLFEQVKRVLKSDGTLWLNLGDSYAARGKDRTPDQAIRKSTIQGGISAQMAGVRQISKVTGQLKQKDLCGIPWRVAFALQADGWYLRQDIIWHKPNPMPESVTDRCTKAHEYIFLLSKSPKYYFDNNAIREECKDSSVERLKREKPENAGSMRAYGGKTKKPMRAVVAGGSFHDHEGDLIFGQRISVKSNHPLGKNKRSVWTVAPKPFKGAHFATFPPNLIEPCILAGSKPGDTILDPFFGAGTTGLVAKKHNREYIGIELNPEYAKMAAERIGA